MFVDETETMLYLCYDMKMEIQKPVGFLPIAYLGIHFSGTFKIL